MDTVITNQGDEITRKEYLAIKAKYQSWLPESEALWQLDHIYDKDFCVTCADFHPANEVHSIVF